MVSVFDGLHSAIACTRHWSPLQRGCSPLHYFGRLQTQFRGIRVLVVETSVIFKMGKKMKKKEGGKKQEILIKGGQCFFSAQLRGICFSLSLTMLVNSSHMSAQQQCGRLRVTAELWSYQGATTTVGTANISLVASL